jgi:hypothetical protein
VPREEKHILKASVQNLITMQVLVSLTLILSDGFLESNAPMESEADEEETALLELKVLVWQHKKMLSNSMLLLEQLRKRQKGLLLKKRRLVFWNFLVTGHSVNFFYLSN